ncbi:MAG: phage terminase small subunit P27 family [Verrucomicrobiota bacterium]
MITNNNTTEATPPAPDWLSESAKEVWNDLAPLLVAEGRLKPHQHACFGAYCLAAGNVRDCGAALARDGIVISGRSGTQVRHPAASILNGAAQQVLSLGKQFGLTPASKARLDKAQPPPRKSNKFRDI